MMVFNAIHLCVMFRSLFPFSLSAGFISLLGLYIAVPVHWPFFGNRCVFTLATIDSDNVDSESGFSELIRNGFIKPSPLTA